MELLGPLDDQVDVDDAFEVGEDVLGAVEHGEVLGAADPVGEVVGVVGDDDDSAARGECPRAAQATAEERSAAGSCR